MAKTESEIATSTNPSAALAFEALRRPFDASEIGLLPKPKKKDSPRGNCKPGTSQHVNDGFCGGYHGLPAFHIPYVGHAEVTDRLLDVDPQWNWEPLATDDNGLPRFQLSGARPIGLWIKLTVLGVTRLGYGSVEPSAFDPEKQLIGDCLVSGTPVLTRGGWVPIEKVEKGMLVANRSGWLPVTDHWQNGEADRTVAVLLDDGHIVVGTPNHRVPTTRGMVALGSLSNADMLATWPDTDGALAAWRWSGVAADIRDIQTLLTDTSASTGSPRRRRDLSCTATSIGRHSALSLTGGTSTIATMSHSTIVPKTLKPLTPRATHSITMQSEKGWLTFVPAAAMNSSRSSALLASIAHGGVPLVAKRLNDGKTGWPTNGRGSDSSEKPGNAWSAATDTSPNVLGHASALRRVVAVLDAGTAPTWNLSVADRHEFVAGGVLVSNSIRNAAMRFGVALDQWKKADRQETTPQPREDAPRAQDTPMPGEPLDATATAAAVEASPELKAIAEQIDSMAGADRGKLLNKWRAKLTSTGVVGWIASLTPAAQAQLARELADARPTPPNNGSPTSVPNTPPPPVQEPTMASGPAVFDAQILELVTSIGKKHATLKDQENERGAWAIYSRHGWKRGTNLTAWLREQTGDQLALILGDMSLAADPHPATDDVDPADIPF